MFFISIVARIIPQDSRGYMLVAATIQAIVAFCGTAWLSARCVNHRPWEFLEADRGISVRTVLGVVIIYLVSIPFMNCIIAWNEQIHLPESMAGVETVLRSWEDTNGAASQRMIDSPSVVNMLCCVLVMGVLTGFSEELLFRGALQRIIAIKGNNAAAIIIAAFIFSALHFQFFGFVPRMILGIWFGYLIFATRSVWAPMLAHTINNSVVVIGGWLTARGIHVPFDSSESDYTIGFPWLPIASAMAIVIILVAGRKWFFFPKHRD
ncbi:MAG: CPBP family intramembrane metalloprotease [Muribaculum sp.]|nr:CPBP family intramembrane metalloprotease [Muribaculum sp.]